MVSQNERYECMCFYYIDIESAQYIHYSSVLYTFYEAIILIDQIYEKQNE